MNLSLLHILVIIYNLWITRIELTDFLLLVPNRARTPTTGYEDSA